MAYNERIVNISYIPTENVVLSDTLTLESEVFASDITLDISGEAVLSSFDIKDNIGMTWDMISFLMFSTYDKILEIWQSNKHLTSDHKKAFTPDPGTPLFIPVLDAQDKAEIKNTSTSILPPWKR